MRTESHHLYSTEDSSLPVSWLLGLFSGLADCPPGPESHSECPEGVWLPFWPWEDSSSVWVLVRSLEPNPSLCLQVYLVSGQTTFWDLLPKRDLPPDRSETALRFSTFFSLYHLLDKRFSHKSEFRKSLKRQRKWSKWECGTWAGVPYTPRDLSKLLYPPWIAKCGK